MGKPCQHAPCLGTKVATLGKELMTNAKELMIVGLGEGGYKLTRLLVILTDGSIFIIFKLISIHDFTY